MKRHKYKIIIEPGLHSGYSEVYVLHLENLSTEPVPLYCNLARKIRVPRFRNSRSSHQYHNQQTEMMFTKLVVKLIGRGVLESESKANLIESDTGEPMLELRLDYSRAWVQIRQALGNC